MTPLLCFIDVETTGTDASRHGLTQIAGAIVGAGGEILEQFNFKVRPFPQDEIEEQALSVTGLTHEQIATHEDPVFVYKRFTAMLGSYVSKYDKTQKLWFVGYNAQFDNGFMRRFFEKNNDTYFGSWFWNPALDVMALAAQRLMFERPGMRDFKLGTVAEALGLTVDGALHDASIDIALTMAIYRHCTQPLSITPGVPPEISADLFEEIA